MTTKKNPVPKCTTEKVLAVISGPSVILDGKPFRASALKVGALRRAMIGIDELQRVEQTPASAAQVFDLMADTVGLSVGKSREEVQDLVDQRELQAAFAAVMAISGATEVPSGEVGHRGR